MQQEVIEREAPPQPGVASKRWNGMSSSFLARRIGRLLASLWVLVTASFVMIHLIPGDPLRAAMGPTASPEAVEARRAALGLNDPLLSQYVRYLKDLLSGDFGTSLISGLPVRDIIEQRLPATLQLAVPGFFVTLAIAVPLGLLVAVGTRGGRRPGLQLGFAAPTIFISAIPDFLLAVVLVYVFSVQLEWLPVAGRSGPASFILPVLALAAGAAASISRIVRAETGAVLGEDYIRTARSKRLPARIIYLRHALPNALTATLTISGLLLSSLAIGSVFVENVFAWQGLGSVFVQSITGKDYSVVQALILVYGAIILVVNLLVDLALAFLDPRSTIRDGI